LGCHGSLNGLNGGAEGGRNHASLVRALGCGSFGSSLGSGDGIITFITIAISSMTGFHLEEKERVVDFGADEV
jgi:hypothetical protein